MSFKQDLKVGEEAEVEFAEFLTARNYDVGLNTAKHIVEKRFYDLWARKNAPKTPKPVKPRNVSTFEVKFDRRVVETKKIYLEHEGLTNSRADYIVYKLDIDGEFYIQGRFRVLQIMGLPQFKQVSGGDKWGTGTLVPIENFKQLFMLAEKWVEI